VTGAGGALKVLLPLVDRLPFTSRLVKVKLSELVTLLFWGVGLRKTARIVLHGIRFRARAQGKQRAFRR
jgi:hypothetical protein